MQPAEVPDIERVFAAGGEVKETSPEMNQNLQVKESTYCIGRHPIFVREIKCSAAQVHYAVNDY